MSAADRQQARENLKTGLNEADKLALLTGRMSPAEALSKMTGYSANLIEQFGGTKFAQFQQQVAQASAELQDARHQQTPQGEIAQNWRSDWSGYPIQTREARGETTPLPSVPQAGEPEPMTVLPSGIPEQHLPYPPGIHEMPTSLPEALPAPLPAAPAGPPIIPSSPRDAGPGIAMPAGPQAGAPASPIADLLRGSMAPMTGVGGADVSYASGAGSPLPPPQQANRLRRIAELIVSDPNAVAEIAARYRAMAGGGYPNASEPVVGERGPEVFVPSTPGAVIPLPTDPNDPYNREKDLNEIVLTDQHAAHIVYQGELRPASWVRMQIPIPKDPMIGMVEITATFCFATSTDPQDPLNYTRSGLEVRFRPHDRKRKDSAQIHPDSSYFFQAKDVSGEEADLRSDAHKWETTLHKSRTMRASGLHNPIFDVHYNARIGGRNAAYADKIPYALVLSIESKKTRDLYNKILQRYPTILEPLRPIVKIPIRT
jgi:hypothetical protein